MDSKLTLKLDKDVIDKAKRFAERRGTSLSRMVESYFSRLTEAEEPIQNEELTGVVAELAGILSGTQIEDPKDEPRKDWKEAFRLMAEAGDDALLDGETSTTSEWDDDNWYWP